MRVALRATRRPPIVLSIDSAAKFATMSTGPNLQVLEAGKANFPAIEKGLTNEKPDNFKGEINAHDSEVDSENLVGPNGEQYPTAEEITTLRRTFGKIPWIIYTVGFVELCERFAYYGTTAVFVNFIAYPLPPNSNVGAGLAGGNDNQSGALGLGQQASTGLTLFNSFWSYLMPVLGAYLADGFWGRFKTIHYAIYIATLGHIIIIISAIPSVIQKPNAAVGIFALGLIFFGMGVGLFKVNISPLIAEQYENHHPRQYVKTLPSGERVIVDPNMTVSRIYMRYYLMVNVGALLGQISMVFAEHYVGFWLSYTLPTIMFLFCPLVMFFCRNRYVKRAPTGDVLGKFVKLMAMAIKEKGKPGDFWDHVKPSNVVNKPKWMTFDDAWVDEVRRGLKACAVFCCKAPPFLTCCSKCANFHSVFPIYWLAYSQSTNNMVQ